MKEIQDKEAAKILDVLFGAYSFQYLAAAVEFDLFTMLSRNPGLTRDEIAQRLGLEIEPARVLLLGLGATGLLRKEGDRYFNTTDSDRYLSKDHPDNLCPSVRFVNHVCYKPLAHFHEALKTNTCAGLVEIPGTKGHDLYQRLSEDPRLEGIFHEMMAGISEQGLAAVLEMVDLSKHKTLLDVAGAVGVNAMALARRWPHLKVTIFDIPTVAQKARERVAKEGLAERVTAIGGNCFEDELPTGFDGIMFSRFLGAWSETRIREILGRAARALRPGAGVVIIDGLQTDDEMGGRMAAHMSAYVQVLATGEGLMRTWGEWKSWLEAAGFTSCTRRRMKDAPEYIIEAVKA